MTASVLRVCARRRTWTLLQLLGLVFVVAAALVGFLPGHASAASTPSVTLSPGTGPYTDGQSITVSGSGFPVHSADPTGLSIIECADPGGTAAGLPTDDSTCDGSSLNPLPIPTDSSGKFTASYTVLYLETALQNAVNCDASNFCVLWVGVDYANAFQSNFAFSAAFEVQPSSTTSTTSASSTTTTTTTGGTTTTTSTTTTSSTSTTTTSPTTTTSEGSTTTTTSGTTTTTSGGGTTTTSSGATTTSTSSPGGSTSTSGPATGSGGGTTGGTGSGSGTVGASSNQLAFTGPPTVLPWLVGFGVILLALGTAGRRLVSGFKP